MLRYFRINDPYRLLALFVLLALITVPLIITSPAITVVELKSFLVGEKVAEGNTLYTDIIDRTPPLASWFYGLCDLMFGRNITVRHIIAILVVFLQGAFLAIVFIDKRAFTENTYVPALLFALIALISFDMFSLTADLVASAFLLLALNAVLTEIEFRVQRDETIFIAGFFAGAASLLNFTHLVFLPGIFIILVIFSRNGLRKYLLMLSGFLLPHALIAVVFYVNGNGGDLLNRFYQENILPEHSKLIGIQSLLMLGAIPLVALTLSFFIVSRQAHLTKYQAQVSQVMFLWLLLGLIQLLLTPDFRPQSLLPVLPVVAFYTTHWLLLIRRRKFAEWGVWLLLIGSVSTLYLSLHSRLPVDYSRLYVRASSASATGKRVLSLTDDPGIYVNNSVAPPFIDWPMTRHIFDQSNQYDDVLLVARLFRSDPPDIIIDPEKRMEGFFARLPAVRDMYEKKADGTWTLISN